MLIERDELCALIPHTGAMCLLDGVLAWSADGITCQTERHRADDNPLRCAQGLAAVHGIEFGAQAMAVHGSLLARQRGNQLPPGYLAAVREVKLNTAWLHDVPLPLEIQATRLTGQGGRFIYALSIGAGGRELVTGRATVVSQPGSTAS